MSHPVQAVERAMGLLEAFADSNGPLSIEEAAASVNLPRSTTYRLIHTLLEANHLQTDGTRFRLAHGVLGLGYGRLRSAGFVRSAQPVLDDLANTTDQTVILAMSKGVTAQPRNPGTITVAAVSRTGGALNVVCNIGQQFSSEDSIVASALQHPTGTVEAGFHGGGNKVRALAVLVKNYDGDPLGVLSIVVPAGRMTEVEIADRYSSPVQAGADLLGQFPT